MLFGLGAGVVTRSNSTGSLLRSCSELCKRQAGSSPCSLVPGSSCQNSSCIPGGVECSGRDPGLFFQEASCERAELSPVTQQAEPECLWDQEQSKRQCSERALNSSNFVMVVWLLREAGEREEQGFVVFVH